MRTCFWSSFLNQANLAYNDALSIGFNYEDRFGIKELSTRTAAVIIPAGHATLGAVYSHFGYSDYKRDLTGLACGMKLSEKIAAGLQIDYYSERTFGEYANDQNITFEASILFLPSDLTRIGICVFNPVPNSLRKISMPSSIRIGAGTYLNKMLFAGAEIGMATGSQMLLRCGFGYEVAKNFILRGGYCTMNNSFSGGIGIKVKMVQVDLAFRSHEQLGISSSLSLIFRI